MTSYNFDEQMEGEYTNYREGTLSNHKVLIAIMLFAIIIYLLKAVFR